MWRKEKLEQEMTFDEFMKEFEDFKSWTNKNRNRRFGEWLWSLSRWCEGDH